MRCPFESPRFGRIDLAPRWLAIASLAALGLASFPLSARAEDPTPAVSTARTQEGSLSDMSLEELLQVQLDQMSVTGIHHTHDAGDWMIGTTTMFMNMDGNQSGTSSLSSGDVFSQGYMITPTSMDMQSYMLHLMAAPTNELTLFLMMPYKHKSMDHLVNPGIPMPFAGTRFTTESHGPGDLKVSGLYSLARSEQHRLIAEGGVSFPTGSIDEEDVTPMSMGQDVRLPYPMQLGSGTYDLLTGLTYIGQLTRWQWGLNGSGVIRLGENANDYRLGNEWKVTVWAGRQFLDWMSSSIRLEGLGWGNISGADPQLNPMMVPTADPDLRAGERLDLLFGLNVFSSEGTLAGHRLSVEGGLPIYQSLTGPQLATAWRLTAAWEWTFNSPLAMGD